MKNRLKRALAAGAVIASVAGLAPLLIASPAFAAGTLAGAATLKTAGGAANLQSGSGATTFTLRPPVGAACAGDTATNGYHVFTFIVSNSVDETALQFNTAGPTTLSTGATVVQPLIRSAGGTAIENLATNSGDGVILSLPDMNFQTAAPGDYPPGVYKLGLACGLGGASATQMRTYWMTTMTITTDAVTGGNANIHFENGTAPAAPVVGAVTPGPGQLSVAYTAPVGTTPALTNCHVIVALTAGGADTNAAGNNSASCTSPIVVSGLTNGTPYFVKVAATNAVTTTVSANEVSGTPLNPAVTGLAAAPSPNAVTLTWGQPSGATPSAPTSYTVSWAPATAGSPQTFACATASCSDPITGLAPGTTYAFTVTYGAAGTAASASVNGTPTSNSILIQDVQVTRPNGALVLTQVCGVSGAVGAEGASLGFPAFPADTATVAAGTPPHVGTLAGPSDLQFAGYPYPDDAAGLSTAVYPTHCALNLGAAHLVKSGPGAGQYFAASGRLNQVTVVDTRDTDPGWTVNFAMGDFTNTLAQTFSGNDLGYTLAVLDTPGFTDGGGVSYDQTVTPGANIVQATPGAGGAGSAHAVAFVPDANPGLGIATIDARIKVLIPVWAHNGDYTGLLTINAV